MTLAVKFELVIEVFAREDEILDEAELEDVFGLDLVRAGVIGELDGSLAIGEGGCCPDDFKLGVEVQGHELDWFVELFVLELGQEGVP